MSLPSSWCTRLWLCSWEEASLMVSFCWGCRLGCMLLRLVVCQMGCLGQAVAVQLVGLGGVSAIVILLCVLLASKVSLALLRRYTIILLTWILVCGYRVSVRCVLRVVKGAPCQRRVVRFRDCG